MGTKNQSVGTSLARATAPNPSDRLYIHWFICTRDIVVPIISFEDICFSLCHVFKDLSCQDKGLPAYIQI